MYIKQLVSIANREVASHLTSPPVVDLLLGRAAPSAEMAMGEPGNDAADVEDNGKLLVGDDELDVAERLVVHRKRLSDHLEDRNIVVVSRGGESLSLATGGG